jgi:hypothetical protein
MHGPRRSPAGPERMGSGVGALKALALDKGTCQALLRALQEVDKSHSGPGGHVSTVQCG